MQRITLLNIVRFRASKIQDSGTDAKANDDTKEYGRAWVSLEAVQ